MNCKISSLLFASLSSMAFLSTRSLFFSFFLLLTLLAMSPRVQLHARKIASHHVISVKSLLPGDVCLPSKDTHHSRLKLVSGHGPCSPSKRNTTRAQILKHDQDRINWLRSEINSKKAPRSDFVATMSQIPAIKGNSFNAGGAYLVAVGFGTPALQQTLLFDTGSSVTWIQCQPCAGSCYGQREQIFDPTKSSTYRNISCTTSYCTAPELNLYTCSRSGATCIYGVKYVDGSFSLGYYATETLAVASTDTVQNFRFGCGQYNGGRFGEIAGLMGLGRRPASLVSQTKSSYGGIFSYCLPSTSSSTGYLSFGSGSVPAGVQYTPMLNDDDFYYLELVSISVGGTKLAIPPTVFSRARTLIDSGSTITHLPPTAYNALRDAFRARMSQYAIASEAVGGETCYDVSGISAVTVPSVALEFRGVTLNLEPSGILFACSATQVCLAFAPNGDDSDVGIIGNVQQRTFNVVYDVPKKQIGFGSHGCS